jgi:hypothetical protein
MKKTAFLLFCISLLWMNSSPAATQWLTLEPEEVMDRANIIVIGRYDFSKDPMRTVRRVFKPYEFKVSQVLKGNPPSTLIAGIATHDISEEEEFQNQGGEFLLFIEKESYSKYALPVGGPNGTIQLMDGELYHTAFNHRVLFEKVKGDIYTTPIAGPLISLLIILTASVIVYRFSKRRITS